MNKQIIDHKEKVSFLFDVLKRYDHYVGTANFKATIVTSYIAATYILSSKIFSTAYYLETLSNCERTTLGVIFIAITLFMFFAIYYIFKSVHPNLKTPPTYNSLIFFGDVANCKNGASGYEDLIKNLTRDKLIKDLSFQTYTVSEIITDKFNKISSSIRIIIWAYNPTLLIFILLSQSWT